MRFICTAHPQGRPGMNGLKGEKGDPADVSSVLGLRVSTAAAPLDCWPSRLGDPNPFGKGHMPPSLRGWLTLWGRAWPQCSPHGDCPLCRTLTHLLSPCRVLQGPQVPQGPLDHPAA